MPTPASAKTSEILLTEGQFSDRYQIPQRTLQRWRSSGDGPLFVRIGPRCVRYRQSDIEAWANSRTFAHRAAELAQRAV
jgi:predicted DNA-binding transcriptional regulator AlpA